MSNPMEVVDALFDEDVSSEEFGKILAENLANSGNEADRVLGKFYQQAEGVEFYSNSPMPDSDLAGIKIVTGEETYHIEFADGDLHIFIDGCEVKGDDPVVTVSSRSWCSDRKYPMVYVANDPASYDKVQVSLENLKGTQPELDIWYVDSMTTEGVEYMVTRLPNGNFACGCKHWRHRLNGTGETCKHIDQVVETLEDEDLDW